MNFNRMKKEVVEWINHREDAFHFKVSLAKSGLRILAGITLVFGSFILAGLLLILAEVLGIVEEI
jgi:hypothetical protein